MVESVHQGVRHLHRSGWALWLRGLPFWAAAGLLPSLASSQEAWLGRVPGAWPISVAAAGFLFGCGVAVSLGLRPWAYRSIAPVTWAAATLSFRLLFVVFDPTRLLPFVLCLLPVALVAAAIFPGLLYRRHGLGRELLRDLPLWALAIVLPFVAMPWVTFLFFNLNWGYYMGPWGMAATVALAGTGGFLVTWSRFEGRGLIGVEA